MNELSKLQTPEGSTRDRKRVGRGTGSGLGKTCGKGHKGQRSRSGSGIRIGFEGGQMPLFRRLPKRGFKNPFKKTYSVVNLRDLARFEAGTEIGPAQLERAGLADKGRQVKLLGDGDLSISLTLRVHKASKSAVEKVQAAGGTVEVICGDRG